MSDYLTPIWKAHPNMRSFTIVFTKCKDDDWCLEQSEIDSDYSVLSNEHLNIVKEGYKDKLKEAFRGEKVVIGFIKPRLSLDFTDFESQLLQTACIHMIKLYGDRAKNTTVKEEKLAFNIHVEGYNTLLNRLREED